MDSVVSIVTVSYNSAGTILDTIESVRNQSYPHIEYIVVDGGSTDGTVDILKKNDTVIDDWISEPDKGIYDAMNKGIRRSHGHIVGILNSDDWYEPNTIKTVVRAFKDDNDVDLVHGAMNLWTEDKKFHARRGEKDHLPPEFTAPFYHPTCFVRRRVFDHAGVFALDLPTAADYDFMLRFMQSGCKDLYIDQVLTNFRQGGVTSEYIFSPYGQIWKVLRRNQRGLLTCCNALLYRGVRDTAAYIMNRFPLNGV